MHQGRDIRSSGIPIHRHDGEQHQHRAEERVEKKLEARIDPARPAPYADDEEHRDQAALEKQIEQGEIERRKGADHQGFQHQECDHVFLDALLDRLPAGQNTDRHQRRGENHEGQRNAIDAHVVADRSRQPRLAFDELKFRRTGIEAHHQNERNRQGEEGRPHRHPAGIAGDGRILTTKGHEKDRADQRQKSRHRQNGPACHLSGLPRPA